MTNLDALLHAVNSRANVWLSGLGKRYAGLFVARELGLPFYSKAVTQQTTVADLLGDAESRTGLRDAFENGGLYLLDEVNYADQAALTAIRLLLTEGRLSFPDADVERHPDFVLIVGSHSSASDPLYVGRQQIDSAVLDRFVHIGI